jgi:putative CocE/NonD family hydrolase
VDKVDYQIVYPNPVPPGVNLEKNVKVTMRDGIRIAVDIYKPLEEHTPLPVILAYSSFTKERIFESAKPGFYCRKGYICIQASERGIGINEGQYTFQGIKSAEDGYDIIEWIAAQPWCNGQVAMMGASGYGVMQWITATLNPPHLKTLVVLATTDNYRGLCYPGGVLRKPFVQYLITALSMGAIWPGPVPDKQLPVNIMAEILSHTEDGPFWWEHGSTWNRIERIKCPVLNMVQAPNRLHTVDHLRSYNDIKSPKKLLITPWTNENYQPWIFETLSFNEYILKWMDYWLKGVQNGILEEPEVAIFDNGLGKWRYEQEYPLARTTWHKFYIHAKNEASDFEGLINTSPPEKGDKNTIYHNISLNTDQTTSYGENITANSPDQADQPRYLVYMTKPLEDDLKIGGPISITLYAATAEEVTSDWSFFVKMGEMVAEGVPLNPVTGRPEVKPEISDKFVPASVHIWSWGCLKAKYRELDAKLSKPGMPWHSFNNPADIKPDTVYEFQIELQPVFKTFKKGNRIWLKIASDDVLYSTRDATSQFVETPTHLARNEITIYQIQEYPSHLLLPVIPEKAEIAPVSSPLREALPGAPRLIK